MFIEKFSALVSNNYFIVFMVLVSFDYITGVAKATIWKVTDSDASIKGIIRHTIVLISVALIWVGCQAFNAEYLAFTINVMYCLNYTLSILENFGVMGIYVPKFLQNKIQAEINRYEQQLENTLDNKDLRNKKARTDVNINIAKYEEQDNINIENNEEQNNIDIASNEEQDNK